MPPTTTMPPLHAYSCGDLYQGRFINWAARSTPAMVPSVHWASRYRSLVAFLDVVTLGGGDLAILAEVGADLSAGAVKCEDEQ